jgi:hypothetical protein
LVGFGLGLGGRSPLLLAAAIAGCSMAFAWLRPRLGRFARRRGRRAAEADAGWPLLVLAGTAGPGGFETQAAATADERHAASLARRLTLAKPEQAVERRLSFAAAGLADRAGCKPACGEG